MKKSRPKTFNQQALAVLVTRDQGELVDDAGDIERPKTRGECGAERPCPWVSCRYHLYLDVNPETGVVKFNHPDKEVWELKESCALDIADRGGVPLDVA